MPIDPSMLCSQCGSVLSAVTFTCVRGENCKPRTESKPLTENQRLAVEAFKTGSRRIFGLTGPSQANTRQTIMFLLTGTKLPKAKCGINAVTVAVREFDPTIPRW